MLLALLWVGLCGVVVALGWLLTHDQLSPVVHVDKNVAEGFADHRSRWLTAVAAVAVVPGNTITGQVALLVLALAFSLWRRSLVPLLFVAVVDAGLLATYLCATHVDPRVRPPVRILDPGLVPDHSFPSGHVGTAVAVCGSAVVLARWYTRSCWRWATPLLLLPLGTLLARLYQGAHYLSDVLVSLFFASVWLGAVAMRMRAAARITTVNGL